MKNNYTKAALFAVISTIAIGSCGCTKSLLMEVGKGLAEEAGITLDTERSESKEPSKPEETADNGRETATAAPESSEAVTKPESSEDETDDEASEPSADETEDTEPAATEEENNESETADSAKSPDYVIPDSNVRYVTEDELGKLSPFDLRLAKNEIFARHGRKFQSEELQEYFNSKSWYEGTIEPSDFDDKVFNVYEKANIKLMNEMNIVTGSKDLPDAPSKELIDSYGYSDGYSVLAFELHGKTAVDRGEYWEVNATYYQGIQAPGNLQLGDTVSLVFDDLTGSTRTLEYRKEGLVEPGTPLGAYQYYYSPSADGSPVTLYQDSDDRVDKRVYEGKLYIRKDATTEIAIINDVRPFTEAQFQADYLGYNGVYFDTKGYATRLVYYGD